jgi:hypothetical protein|tara:strand:+ start:131 stop:592 length:462 start_codon:yes stop_codon:yes gene_type:complete
MALQKRTNKMYRFSDYILEQGSSTSSMGGVGSKKEDESPTIWAQSSNAGFGQPKAVDDPPGGDDFDPNEVDFLLPETWPGDLHEFHNWYETWWDIYGNDLSWGMRDQWNNLSSRNTISMLGGGSMQSAVDAAYDEWRIIMMEYLMDPNTNPNM